MNANRTMRGMLLAVVLSSSALLAQAQPSSACAPKKKRLEEVVAAAGKMRPEAQLAAYLSYLATVPDDPEDCVTSDVRSTIGSVERQLISWKIGDRSYKPDKVLHCNEIEKSSQACKGSELDDTPLADERTLANPLPALPKTGVGELDISQLPAANVIGVFAQERSQLQDGRAPVRLEMRGRSLSLAELSKWQHPALIVIFRLKDALNFRKCVWLF